MRGELLRDDGLLLDWGALPTNGVFTQEWARSTEADQFKAWLFLLKSSCVHEKDSLSFSCDIHDSELSV